MSLASNTNTVEAFKQVADTFYTSTAPAPHPSPLPIGERDGVRGLGFIDFDSCSPIGRMAGQGLQIVAKESIRIRTKTSSPSTS